MNLSQSLTGSSASAPPPRFAARDSFVICLLIPSVTLERTVLPTFSAKKLAKPYDKRKDGKAIISNSIKIDPQPVSF